MRPPLTASDPLGNRALSGIESAVVGEKAASLGVAASVMQRALGKLSAAGKDAPRRDELVQAATDAAHAYLVQRELCGMRDRRQAIADYAIPGEVVARIGATPRKDPPLRSS